MKKYLVQIANSNHYRYAPFICQMIKDAAKIRGTGIAQRKPEYIQKKMEEGKAVLALDGDKVIGFCYIENWSEQKYISNSGLIVHPDYRGLGIAKMIKKAIFKLSREKFPNSKLFGITTSMAVMKINSILGYSPVPFSELTDDDTFWNGCKTCPNYDILERTDRKMCLCTGMIYDPATKEKESKKKMWERFKIFLKRRKK